MKLTKIFRKLTKKTILAVLAIIVIGVPVLYLTVLNQKEASAWFDENWNYRAAVPISAHTAAENNVYITVTIDTATPIAAGKMQSDCGDLRFTKENGEILPYFINASPGCNNAATTIQVNFDSFPTGAQTIYYYYGNTSAANGFNNAGFSTAATGATIGSVGTETQGPGPVGYWKFDDGQGQTAQDSSSSNNDGTLGATTGSSTDDPTWTTEDQCVSGKCLSFDGGDYVGIGSTASGVKTVSFWVKPKTNGESIIDLDGGSHKITASSGTITATGFTNVYVNGVQTSTLTANTWQQITAITSTAFTATGITIGKASTTYLNGFLDEVKIYPYARTAVQIKTDYNSRGAAAKSGTGASLGAKPQDWISNGLVGYWKMDESSGNAADSSGNGTTLTNNNTTAYAAGKFGNGGSFTAASLHYFSTATTISGVKTVAFWVNPSASTDEYVNLTSSAYITSSSGTITATGFTSPSIYVNGVLNGTVTASAWNHVVITTDTGVNANAFEVGRANSSYVNGTIDETRIYNRALSPAEVRQLADWAPGPVGYWNFEEGSGTAANDTSGNANNGSWAGTGTTHWTAGKYGKAGKFNGIDDVVSVANTISGINTVSFWVKPSSTTANILDINTSGPTYISASSGTISATGFTSSTYYINGVQTATPTLTANTWQYITVTTATALSGSAISLGKANGTFLSGQIDDVKIYNYARTQKQVVSDMNAGHPAVGSPVGSAVGYWKFDEGYGTTANDSTPNANSLTLSSASWTNSGKFGKAWNGTGAVWASRADDSDFDVIATDDYAVSLWYKSDSATNPGAIEYLFNKANATTAGYAIYANTSGNLCFGIDDDTSWGPDVSSCTSTDVYDGTWHHVIGIRDTVADKTLIYVDGVLQDSDTDTTSATLANSLSLYIGDRDGTDNGDEFNGDIDEVKVYRYALTADEVKTEYNRGSSLVLGAAGNNSTYAVGAANQEYCVPGDATSCAAPVGRWDFEEGSGSNAQDSSGGGNTGSIAGATYTNGKQGKALNFNGSTDTVTVANTLSTKTVEFWVNPATTTQNLIDLRTAATAVSISVSSGTISATGFTSPIYYVNGIQTTSPTLTANSWQHVAVTTSTAISASAIRFGRISSTSLTGKLDAIRFFDYARSSAQVAWDYNRGKPVGWWKMDECQGTTANDSSGNSNTGTITIGALGEDTVGTCTTSSTAWGSGATGKRNASLSFDGTDDYVSLPNDIFSNAGTNSYSVSFWSYRTTTSGWRGVINQNNEPRIQFGTNTLHANAVTPDVDAISTLTSSTNVWEHWVVIIGTGSVSFYKNGIFSNEVAGTITFNSGYVRIGASGSVTPVNFFQGQIDDVRVYNYALTATQVKDVYNGGAVNFAPLTGSP